jgi:hypothetical protein
MPSLNLNPAAASKQIKPQTGGGHMIDIGIGLWLFPWWWHHHHCD